jgi:hypothetical protein
MPTDPNANLKLIRKITSYWVHGQFDKILPSVADDAVYEIGRGVIGRTVPLFGTFRGKKQIQDWYTANAKSTFKPFCRVEQLGEFFASGNRVVNLGTMPKTRLEPDCDWVAIWTLRRNMVIHCWLVLDTASVFLKWKRLNPKAVLRR